MSRYIYICEEYYGSEGVPYDGKQHHNKIYEYEHIKVSMNLRFFF
jgi:hypothetical protein